MHYKSPMQKYRGQSGFTLIELMITLVVAAILLMVGVPGFLDMYKNNRLLTAANALAASVNLARSEAITRGVRVKICKSATSPNCTGSGDWQQGWVVMVDNEDVDGDGAPDGNGVPDDIDSDGNPGPPIRVYQALEGGVTMVGSGGVGSLMSFNKFGRSEQSGTIKVCDDRTGNSGWQLALGADGRLADKVKVTCP